MKQYMEAGVGFDLLGAEKTFKLKLQGKKFKITGDTVELIPKEDRV